MRKKYFAEIIKFRLSLAFISLVAIGFNCCIPLSKETSKNDFRIMSKVSENQDLWIDIFDGRTLDNWDGDPVYWHVIDGILVGEVTPETILDRNSFIIWQGIMPDNFELKLEYRVSENGNSGINYRSELVEGIPYALRGYQADLDGKQRYTGNNYEERKRTTIASRGEKVALPAVDVSPNSLQKYITKNNWKLKNVVEQLGDKDELATHIKREKWNEYHLIINKNRLQHFINGILMSEVIDNDPVNQSFSGMLGVQVHVGPPMRIEYRNIRIKKL